MSASLIAHKIEFSVFGRGYDDDRGNSGKGYPEPIPTGLNVNQAVFDETGRYCWLELKVTSGELGVFKYDTTTWQPVSQGNVPRYLNVFHPYNVENNIGIVAYETNMCVFDLTTNEIRTSGTSGRFFSAAQQIEGTLDGDTFRFTFVNKRRTNQAIYTINLDTLSTSYIELNDRSACGFIDANSVYMTYPPEWFNQWWSAFSINSSGEYDWSIQATDEDSHSFIRLGYDAWGLTGNGKIYIPSLIDGKWVIGEFNALSTPDLNTPTPQRTYGEFPSRPSINEARAYTNGKTKGAFSCSFGTYVIDFVNRTLEKITDTVETVRGMSDSMLICSNGKVYYI